jgi:hypothetical protein
MMKTGRSSVHFAMRSLNIFFNLLNTSRNLPGGSKARQARKTDNLTAIYDPIV